MPIYHSFFLPEQVPFLSYLASNNLFHISTGFPAPAPSLPLVSSSIIPTIHLTQVTPHQVNMPFMQFCPSQSRKFYDSKKNSLWWARCRPRRLMSWKHSWKYHFKAHVQHHSPGGFQQPESILRGNFIKVFHRCIIAGTPCQGCTFSRVLLPAKVLSSLKISNVSSKTCRNFIICVLLTHTSAPPHCHSWKLYVKWSEFSLKIDL